MRTLQRLRYVQTPDQREVRRIHNAERRKVTRAERGRWARRLRVGARALLPAALVFTVAWWLFAGRLVVDGQVEAHFVVPRAPAPVWVAEVLCSPGQRTAVGDPLVRLEPRETTEERRTLELAVDQRRLRLSLVLAGGSLSEVDLGRRGDRLVDAGREVDLAAADERAATASIAALESERVALEVELRRALTEQQGAVASLEERLSAAQAQVAAAHADRELAEFDERIQARLLASGVSAERAAAAAALGASAAEHGVEALEAEVRAVDEELTSARALVDLDRHRLVTELAELDARLEHARTQVATAALRVELWQSVTARQAELGARVGPGEAARLHELELALLRSELEEAESRLAEFDRLAGAVLVRAEEEGVIDRVFVRAGHVLEAGEPLVRYYDPRSLRVVAYVESGGASELWPGRVCRVVPAGERDALDARVSTIDSVWGPLPGMLSEGPGGDLLRLPVRLDCDFPAELQRLGLGRRVRVVFDRPPAAERAAFMAR